jgi:hypothetical protein
MKLQSPQVHDAPLKQGSRTQEYIGHVLGQHRKARTVACPSPNPLQSTQSLDTYRETNNVGRNAPLARTREGHKGSERTFSAYVKGRFSLLRTTCKPQQH